MCIWKYVSWTNDDECTHKSSAAVLTVLPLCIFVRFQCDVRDCSLFPFAHYFMYGFFSLWLHVVHKQMLDILCKLFAVPFICEHRYLSISLQSRSVLVVDVCVWQCLFAVLLNIQSSRSYFTWSKNVKYHFPSLPNGNLFQTKVFFTQEKKMRKWRERESKKNCFQNLYGLIEVKVKKLSKKKNICSFFSNYHSQWLLFFT